MNSITDIVNNLRNLLDIKPLKKRAKPNYPPAPSRVRNKERRDEIKRLRFVENLTLQEIADKYSISRERVRQIIGNSGMGYKKRKIRKFVIDNKDKTNEDVASQLGLSPKYLSRFRSDHRHAISSSNKNREMGARWEEIVSKILTDHGIGNRLMPHQHKFDILLDNGKRIDVKSSASPMHPPTSKGVPFYSFNIDKKGRGDYCDFFILVVVSTVDLFIIPSGAAPKDYVRMIWPKYKRESKYYQYHNRFDLLK